MKIVVFVLSIVASVAAWLLMVWHWPWPGRVLSWWRWRRCLQMGRVAQLLTSLSSPTEWVPRPSRSLRRAGVSNPGSPMSDASRVG
jgi:hypothetical protein